MQIFEILDLRFDFTIPFPPKRKVGNWLSLPRLLLLFYPSFVGQRFAVTRVANRNHDHRFDVNRNTQKLMRPFFIEPRHRVSDQVHRYRLEDQVLRSQSRVVLPVGVLSILVFEPRERARQQQQVRPLSIPVTFIEQRS